MKETLIFLHVPKAAGSTMRTILEGFYDEDEVFIVKDDIPGDERRFRDRTPQVRARTKLIFGHICWGWHRMVPGKSAYMTMLRNPTERVQSLYMYIKRSSNHFLHGEVRDMSLVEFVESGVHADVDNGMVRQLCGTDHFYNTDGGREPYNDSYIPYGEITHEHLHAARRNLLDCKLVGTVDMFDVFLKALCSEMRIGIPAFRVKNRTPHTQKRPPKCDERIAIDKYNRFDWELYMLAQEIMHEVTSRLR